MAEYFIGNDITSNTTWSGVNTYNITANIKIAVGVTLTVQGGVTINMYNSGNANALSVEGSLNLNGGSSRVTILGKIKSETGKSPAIVINNCDMSAGSGGYYDNGIELKGGTLSIDGCSFTNYTNYGVNTIGCSPVQIDNSIFDNSSSVVAGIGGIFSTSGTVTIRNCNISGFNNSGYGINGYTQLNLTLTNCLIYNNSIGVYVDHSDATIINCTLADNSVGIKIETAGVTLKNTIMYFNTANFEDYQGYLLAITYSCIEGGYSGTGNISSDPLFAKASGRTTQEDYRIKSTVGRWNGLAWVTDSQSSPCIDTGDPSSSCWMEPRPNGGIINMGFDGGTVYASKGADNSSFNVNSDITFNSTWFTGDSYYITGNIKINAGVTLTVEPGVTINMFNNGNPYTLTVDGNLIINGGSSRVTILGVIISGSGNSSLIVLNNCDMSGNSGGDYYNGVEAGGGTVLVDGCSFTNYSHFCIYLNECRMAYINDSLFENNASVVNGAGGIWTSTHTVIVNNCNINGYNSGSGIMANFIGFITISNCLIYDNSFGLYLDGVVSDIFNCTIADNATGISVNNTNAIIKNSIIYFNAINMSYILNDPLIHLSYCCIEGGFTGISNISTDPLFAKASGRTTVDDYRVKSTEGRWYGYDWVTDSQSSPCIGAGDPLLFARSGQVPINIGFEGGTLLEAMSSPLTLGRGMFLF